MAKAKELTLPNTPTYQTDKVFKEGYTSLLDYGKNLASGDLSGNLSWLQPLVNNNNSANALSYAQGVLQPQFRDTLTQIKNEAAANGQLESSTFTDALARSQSDLNSQYQSIVSQQAINDSNMSNQNRMSLFGQGLQTIGQATTFGKSNQDSENQFNLANYDNLVAQAIQNNKNANRANGWQQAVGMLVPGFGKDYLESQGINSVPGYGTADVAKIAGSFMGGFAGMPGGGGGIPTSSAGQYASNNPFSVGLRGNDYGQLYTRN